MRNAVLFGAMLAFFASTAPATAERPRDPVFASLVDQRGHAFTLASLRGTPLVVTFVATHCLDACPLVNAQIGEAADIVRREHRTMRFLTITLDPEHDHLRDMQRLATTFGADPKEWIFASGSPSNVHAIMRAFNVLSQQGRHGYADVHTTFVYLVDTHSHVRKTLLASTALTANVVEEVHRSWSLLEQ